MEIFETRDEMVRKLLRPGSRIVEIGVFEGEFAKVLLSTKPEKLWLIDPWDGISISGDADGNNVKTVNLDTVYWGLVNEYHKHEVVRLIRGRSPPALCNVPDFVDCVYIDGDHSYEGVKKDLLVAERIVRPGGWIMGHDYSMNMNKAKNVYNFGVKRAVDEFCAEKKLSLAAVGMDGCVSYAIRIPETTDSLPFPGWGC